MHQNKGKDKIVLKVKLNQNITQDGNFSKILSACDL